MVTPLRGSMSATPNKLEIPLAYDLIGSSAAGWSGAEYNLADIIMQI